MGGFLGRTHPRLDLRRVPGITTGTQTSSGGAPVGCQALGGPAHDAELRPVVVE